MEEDMRRTAGPQIIAHSNGIPVTVEEHVSKDIYGWARATDREVSGLMLVKLVNGAFHVYKAFLPEQDSSHGLTVLRSESQGRLYHSLLKKYGAERYAEIAGDLKGWWHSHNTMGCFWSGTDDNQAQSLAANAGDWSLSIVVNHQGEYRCRADFVTPVRVMLDKLAIKTVSNTGMQTKHNYKKENDRWNHPMVYKPQNEPKRIAAWQDGKIVISKVDEVEDKFINVSGHTMLKSVYIQVMECPCGDMTCTDCKEALRGVATIH